MAKKIGILGFQKKYIAFFTVVPLLFVLALIEAPCPICDGEGIISSTGMDKVVILNMDTSLQSVTTVESCFHFRIYTYNILMTLQNNSLQQDAAGYVRLGLIDYTKGTILFTNYSIVEVPATTLVQRFFGVTFAVDLDSPTTTHVTAEVITSSAPCKSCNGTGIVALHYLPLLNSMKKTFTEVQRVAVTPIQQIEIDPADIPEELLAQEWNTDQWILEHPEGEYLD